MEGALSLNGRPTPSEERRIAMAGRAKRWERVGFVTHDEKEAIEAAGKTQWRTARLPARLGLFVLTLIAMLAFGAFLGLLSLNGAPVVVGVAGLVVAEILIWGRHFFRSGIEEALWFGGLAEVVREVWLHLPFESTGAVLISIAAVLLVAGLRLLNWMMVLVGLAFLIGSVASFTESLMAAGLATAVLAFVAAGMQLRKLERPFFEKLSAWVAVLGPLAAAVLTRHESASLAIALAAAFAVLLLFFGFTYRSHALIAGGGISVLVLGVEAFDRMEIEVDWKLIAGGALAFAVAALLDRWLRAPRRGITSHPLDREGFGALTELGVIGLIAPSPAPEAAHREGEGGAFGGAGASGEY